MTPRRFAAPLVVALGVVGLCRVLRSEDAVGILRFSGACDASAAVALDDATFIVADDEDNTFRLYRCDRPGLPAESIPWDAHLGIDRQADEHPEADIEGAAMLGDHVYWISSHGRNKDGKWRPNRHRFFAITVTRDGKGTRVEPFGKPVDNLATTLVADRRLRRFKLDAALRPQQDRAKELAPKREGFNIEGLSAMADGRSLLLGLRNPRPNGKALLIPLVNPEAVVREAASPEFGDPIELDLRFLHDGETRPLGVRSIEYSRHAKSYMIVAGPQDEEKVFAVYRWSGNPADPPRLLPQDTATVNREPAFTPEALVLFPGHRRILVLSDDGALRVKVGSPAECGKGAFDNGYCEAKDLLDGSRKTFRGLWLVGD
ncbi:MAG: DUF3616 domain-containing protein [Planctomycetia bacterium]|nr:DUF3616 domain-containing protein [Planctomycetia bacterium]